MEKIIDKKRSIGQAALEIGVRTHVIRFWEEKFPQIKPQIGKGDRRYYFDYQMEVLFKIKSLLHNEGYTISGLQKLLGKRKKLDEKQENIEFLLDKNEFEIDDFIKDDGLKKSQKDTINAIILRIEENLKKLS
ncbi:MAG: DNA-binding transcriptional MerR regulator [Lentimonas sp.]|jgi:DNA-binding transcriptional MerR regulator